MTILSYKDRVLQLNNQIDFMEDRLGQVQQMMMQRQQEDREKLDVIRKRVQDGIQLDQAWQSELEQIEDQVQQLEDNIKQEVKLNNKREIDFTKEITIKSKLLRDQEKQHILKFEQIIKSNKNQTQNETKEIQSEINQIKQDLYKSTNQIQNQTKQKLENINNKLLQENYDQINGEEYLDNLLEDLFNRIQEQVKEFKHQRVESQKYQHEYLIDTIDRLKRIPN